MLTHQVDKLIGPQVQPLQKSQVTDGAEGRKEAEGIIHASTRIPGFTVKYSNLGLILPPVIQFVATKYSPR